MNGPDKERKVKVLLVGKIDHGELTTIYRADQSEKPAENPKEGQGVTSNKDTKKP